MLPGTILVIAVLAMLAVPGGIVVIVVVLLAPGTEAIAIAVVLLRGLILVAPLTVLLLPVLGSLLRGRRWGWRWLLLPIGFVTGQWWGT